MKRMIKTGINMDSRVSQNDALSMIGLQTEMLSDSTRLHLLSGKIDGIPCAYLCIRAPKGDGDDRMGFSPIAMLIPSDLRMLDKMEIGETKCNGEHARTVLAEPDAAGQQSLEQAVKSGALKAALDSKNMVLDEVINMGNGKRETVYKHDEDDEETLRGLFR